MTLSGDLPAPSLDDLVAMIGVLKHRGPDEHGVYRDQRAGLGHARLSIIDLATGQQPLSNEDGTLWVVFNGEIFNHVELRVELEALGHRFRTRSDTEVIVHAWESWGGEAFARFNGQFAIALWDARAETLVLARDRLGIRPLYLCERGGRLSFASEVKALFAGDANLPRALDPMGLAETFTLWSTVAPQTVFTGVTQLEPGHYRTYSEGRVEDRTFWEPTFPVDDLAVGPGDLEDAARELEAELKEAVRLRMVRADVPVGSYLSGGLDSSLVAAMGRDQAAGRFQTFSIRFEDSEFDESVYQRMMAERLNSEHHEITVTKEDIGAVFPDVIEHTEQPILRTAPAPLFLLSRLVRQSGIKVVLTGEGADEFFAGYDLFREAKVRRFWGRQPDSRMRPLLLDRLYPYLARSPMAKRDLARAYFGRDRHRWQEQGFGHRTRWQAGAALGRLFRGELLEDMAHVDVTDRVLSSLPEDFRRWTYLAQDQYLEARTLLSGYLLSSQGDRMLMANSVEGRFPFLDGHVVERANALPGSYKLRGLDEKHILKRIASDLVPEEILRRPKQPYRAPDAHAFVGAHAPSWVAEVMSESALASAGIFDVSSAQQLWRKCQGQPPGRPFSNADNMALVGVISTQLVHERFIRAAPPRPTPITLHTLVDRLAERQATESGASSTRTRPR